jgi:integrase/recombinase XerD
VRSSESPGVALVAAAADADWVTRLVLAWLAAKRSPNTRAAYARDIGITPQRRTSRAASWLAWCQAEGVHPVTGISGLHVTQYARQLDDAGLSPATAARKLAAVAGWYAWLAQRGHITASPAAGLERPKVTSGAPVTPALTRDQAVALLHAADAAQGPRRARAAALVAVLLFTGARVSEIIGADVEDLGTDQGRPVLWVTRPDGRRQGLALPGPAASRIDAYLAGRADLTAAPGQSWEAGRSWRSGQSGGRHVLFATRTGRRLFAADVGQILRRLAIQAALPAELSGHLVPHAMRHTFAALYLEAGGSPRDLQAALGHSDARTTRRYDRAGHTSRRPPGHMIAAYLEDPS